MTDTLRTPAESHFTEGEPDLEPPEELAIAELDEQAMLEEELDNDDVDELDVDDDVLQDALEDLVHADDDTAATGEDDGAAGDVLDELAPLEGAGDVDDVDGALGARDREEGLDVVLQERLDLLDPPHDGDEEQDPVHTARPVLVMETGEEFLDLVEVAPRGRGEFVCRSCFLVRTRAQLADGGGMTCRDCSA